MANTDTLEFRMGELTGQVRELIHTLNDVNTKLDALSHQVVRSSTHGDDIGDLKSRVQVLETKVLRGETAVGIGSWVIRVLPWASIAGIVSIILRLHGVF